MSPSLYCFAAVQLPRDGKLLLIVVHNIVSFRQGCEACLCKSEPAAEGRLGADVFCKHAIHVIADAISKMVADGAHTVEPDDQGVAIACG